MSDVVFTNEMDEEMILNMGPHHPSTHGVLRFIVQSDGEIIRKAVPDVGYLHRSIEKIGERCTYPGYMPYTDRVDYVAAMFANECWAMACEKLMGIEVPPRAQYLRVISCELNRIASHFAISLGTMAMDVGAVTPFPYALREREYINDFIEELCGARLTYNYHRIGGVSFDMPKGWHRLRPSANAKSGPLWSSVDPASFGLTLRRRTSQLLRRIPDPSTALNNVIEDWNFRSYGLPSISRIARPSTAVTSAVHSLRRDPRTAWPR